MKPWEMGWRDQATELNRLTSEARDALEEAWEKIDELQAALEERDEEISRLQELTGET